MNFRVLCRALAILSIIILVVGCSNRSIMMDVDIPQELKNQAVVIPPEGVVITSALHLVGDVEILGGGPIFLRGEGRIVVEKNSQVRLVNISIQASEIKAVEGEKPVYLVSIKQGESTSLLIENSRFFINIPYGKPEIDAPWDQPPKLWTIGVASGGSDLGGAMGIAILNSHFFNVQPYAAGALALTQSIKGKVSPKLKGKIEGSEFHGFHGVIVANNLDGFSIAENSLVRNSFSNIFVHGDSVNIKGNKILFPGNGTTGDGITALGKFTNSMVVNNSIFAGSCYGVLIRGKDISGLTISGNSIVNGISSAIYVEGSEDNASGVSVSGNMIAGNYGFAVVFVGVEESVVESNNFSDNAKGFLSQIYMESSSRVLLRDNLTAPALTPEWAKGLQLYRSHVSNDDSIFMLPGVQADDGGKY